MPSSPGRHSSAALLPLIVGMMMLQPLSTDLYLASLPHLVKYFEVSVGSVQMTLSIFVIGFGLAQLVLGPVSDRFGRKPVALSGAFIYLVASATCAVAPTLFVLLLGRLGQAIGCCAGVLAARAIVRDCMEPAEGAHYFARASVFVSAAPLIGPILGSYLQMALGWRANFAALTILAGVLWVLLLRRLVETNQEKNPHATQMRGVIATYLGIIRSRSFWTYAAPGGLSFMAMFTFIAGSSFVLIGILDVPTQYYGYCFAVGVVGYIGGATLCRRMLRLIGMDRTLRRGAALAAGAGLVFVSLTVLGVVHWWVVVACQFFIMMAHGINFPCAQSGAVASFPRNAGAAAGMLGFIVMAGALTSSSLLGMTHDGTVLPMALICSGASFLLLLSVQFTRRQPAKPH